MRNGHVDLEEQEEAGATAKKAARDCPQGEAAVSLALVKAALRGVQRTQLQTTLKQRAPDRLWLRATGGKPPDHSGLPRGLQRQLSQLRAGRCPTTLDVRHRFGSGVRKLVDIPSTNGPSQIRRRIGITYDAAGVITEVAEASPATRVKIGVAWTLVRVADTPVRTATECDAALVGQRGKKGVKLYFNKVASADCPACGGAKDGTEHLLRHCPAYAEERHSVFGAHTPPLTVLRNQPWRVAKFLKRVGRDAVRSAAPAAAEAAQAPSPADGAAAATAPAAPAAGAAATTKPASKSTSTSTSTTNPRSSSSPPLASGIKQSRQRGLEGGHAPHRRRT
eukprot:gene7136-biopygen6636